MTRAMYDSMSQLVGESSYPDLWWDQRQTCMDTISPGLSDTLERAWQVSCCIDVELTIFFMRVELKGMVKYWDIGGEIDRIESQHCKYLYQGVKEDYWIQCEDKEREWFEFNCTYLPNIGQNHHHYQRSRESDLIHPLCL